MSDQSGGFRFWVFLIAGWGVIGFGIWTLLGYETTAPTYTTGLALASNFFHDLVVAPLVGLAGLAITRFVKGNLRAPVLWAVATTAVVLVIGFIPLLGYGSLEDNPSLQPLNYFTAIPTVIGVIWAIAVAWYVVASIRQRSARAE